MPVVEIKGGIPKRKTGTRKSKYPFSPKEVESAKKLLAEKGAAGCGPYNDIREARSAAQRLQRLLVDAGVAEGTIGVTAFELNDEIYGGIRKKSE